jgi:probable rRNA maturation factor
MQIEILIEDERWRAMDLDSLAGAAACETLLHLAHDPTAFEISLMACGDERIAGLNAQFRDKPVATNVLSWPLEELRADIEGHLPTSPEPDFDGVLALGDIALSYDSCQREAAEAGKPMTDHVTHLIVHAVLHLLGYDHERDLDAAVMQAVETEILGKMGLDDPYRG